MLASPGGSISLPSAVLESRLVPQLFLRLDDRLPELIHRRNTGRSKRIFRGIAPDRRGIEWIIMPAAVNDEHVLSRSNFSLRVWASGLSAGWIARKRRSPRLDPASP